MNTYLTLEQETALEILDEYENQRADYFINDKDIN